ncbi:MAG TPA: 50S ribosomal protein L17 [Candidatus Magasanikbacteria bacterium]|nr:MAG: 50S ribosomal protein L17 [Candidatus Magasanikbacteria bacterium RIFOXYC2_FULL_39_8]HAT03927.1 50S ribosomal protein L17 [Candidatus Magasanikbacteria bacterium]
MRHQKKTVKLGRTRAPRQALLRNLAESLILHGAIVTTKAKAKALRSVVEPLVTKAKKGRPVDREGIMSVLYTGKAVKKLVDDLAPRYAERRGGYTRITKIGTRSSDGGEKVKIEFV